MKTEKQFKIDSTVTFRGVTYKVDSYTTTGRVNLLDEVNKKQITVSKEDFDKISTIKNQTTSKLKSDDPKHTVAGDVIHAIKEDLNSEDKNTVKLAIRRYAELIERNKISDEQAKYLSPWLRKVAKPTEIKTSKKVLQDLAIAKAEADKAFFEYRVLYNKQHNVESGTMIKKIIALHVSGKGNKAIIAEGYNKNTVNRSVNLYKKRVKKEVTTVSKFLRKE